VFFVSQLLFFVFHPVEQKREKMVTIEYEDDDYGSKVMKITIPWPLKQMREEEWSELSHNQQDLLKSVIEEGYLRSSQSKQLPDSLLQIISEYGIATSTDEEIEIEVSKLCPGCYYKKPLAHFSRRRHLLTNLTANCCDNCLKKAQRNRYNLKRNYSIDHWDYLRMLIHQRGICAVCRTRPESGLHVDHCHKSGKVRELLCRNCNLAIGHFKDDMNRLRAANEYLERHRNASPPSGC
jgi:hypothetical protein